jgi:tetratricopeptide (TPR) repeat protein
MTMSLTAPVAALTVVALGCAGAAVATSVRGQHTAPQVRTEAPATTGTDEVSRLQQRLREVPGDWQSWGGLGLDYVQRARTTLDPTYYPKAQQAIDRSLALNDTDNVIGYAAAAALAAARHDFGAARSWAQRGLIVDPQSGVLYGALADAQTQLGDYAAAARASAKMENLDPGTSAEARLSYVAELRGDIATATSLMRTARDDAGSSADVAFTRFYLGDLAWGSGNPRSALADYVAGAQADPSYAPLIEGRARAEAALGQTTAALRDYAHVTSIVPAPTYLVEYGELLQATGDPAGAQQQYALVRTEERLFRANGVALDSDATLFEADHGSPSAAVALGRQAIVTRPFLDSYDAYGWALHRAGNDKAALTMVDRALATGVRNALFRYHRGAIEMSLHKVKAGHADLRTALQINPAFSPLAAPVAQRLLAAAS